jgi:archaellum component FlaC
MLNTHKAYKALQDAGVADKQAEVMVDIFADMQQENALTKFDLSQATEILVREQRATNHRIDSLGGRVDKFETEVNQRFDKIDERFDKIDVKFEKIDAKFEKIDAKFEKIDEKFEKIDQRFEKIDEKFEKIDQRFEKIDAKLIQHDAKFNELDQRMQIGFTELKQDNVWMRRIMFTIATTMIAFTTKYLLSN